MSSWKSVCALLVTLGLLAGLPGEARAVVPGSIVAVSAPQPQDSIPLLGERVTRLSAAPPSVELGRALRSLSGAYHDDARHELAIETAERGIAVLRELNDPGELASSHNSLGLIHWLLARYDEAVGQFELARAIWTELNDIDGLGRVYNNLGSTHYQWGNFELAMEAFLQSLPYRRQAGDLQGEGRVLANLALTYQDWGQYERALEAVQEAVVLADRAAAPAVQGYAHHVRGGIYLSMEEWERAEEALNTALQYFSPAGSGNTLTSLALLQIRRGEGERAIPVLEEMLATARLNRVPRHEARTLLHLGQAYRSMGELPEAIRYLEEGLEVARGWDQRPLTLQMLAELADVHELRGSATMALRDLRAANALRDSIFDQAVGQRIAGMEARIESEFQDRENRLLREEQARRELVIQRQRAGVLVGGILLLAALLLAAVLARFNRKGREREALLSTANEKLEGLNAELRAVLSEVKTLKGLIPICAHCKRVRDDKGYWEGVESYISERSELLFSHSICTECGPELYGADWDASGQEEMAEAEERG